MFTSGNKIEKTAKKLKIELIIQGEVSQIFLVSKYPGLPGPYFLFLMFYLVRLPTVNEKQLMYSLRHINILHGP